MRQLKPFRDGKGCIKSESSEIWISLGIIALYTIAGSLFFFTKSKRRQPGKKIDIEIRYESEIDADTTLLAQNLVKIIRMVLTPLESKINKEEAKLIFVYGDNSWEMRVRNGSEKIRRSVKKLLEAREW